MSPAASLEFRVPGNHQEPPQPKTTPYCQFPSNPSFVKSEYVGESCGGLFNSGRSVLNGRAQEVRSKPRLVKVRKGFNSRCSRSSAPSSGVDSGYNPFQSLSQSSTKISATSGSLRGGDHSLSGLGFENREPSNKEKLETVGDGESVRFDEFVFGSGWVNDSKKSEGQRATSSGAGGEPQNCGHSSFVFGTMGNSTGLNSTNFVGTRPIDHDQTSSHPNQAGFVYGSGVSTASSSLYSTERDSGFSACFVGTYGIHGMKENVKLDSENKTGLFYGDNKNLSVGNNHLDKKESNYSAGHLGAKTVGSRQGQEDNYFVFNIGNSYSTHRYEEAKKPGKATTKSSSHQGTVSGDRSATMSSSESPSDVKLSEDLRKLNIDNITKAVHDENLPFSSTEAPVDANDTFVFNSSRSHSTSSTGLPDSDRVIKMKAAGNSQGIDGLNNSSVKPAADNLFVFTTKSTSAFAKSNFSQNLENGEGKVKEDVGRSPFPTATKCGTYATSEEEKKVDPIGLSSSSMDFKMPQWDKFSFSANTCNSVDRKSEHGVKSGIFKDVKSKKTKGKPGKPDILKQKLQQANRSDKSMPHINAESMDCYSPMDFSPYEECQDTEQFSTEGNVKFNPYASTDVNCTPVGRSCVSSDNQDVNISAVHVDSQSKLFSGIDVASGAAETGVYSDASHQKDDVSQVEFASSSGTGTHQFMFTASSSTQGHSLSLKRLHKKKYKVKAAHVPSSSACAENEATPFESKVTLKFMTDEETSTSALSSAEEACEKWRLRGNQAYKCGDLNKAESFYTWGINSVPSGEASGYSVTPLVLCYSNRAATRMSLGRVREALEDCLVAVKLDPGFLKAQIRAANCHLMLGELEEAKQSFNKCLESRGYICLDRQHAIAASDGLQRVQKVADYISQAEELVNEKTSEGAVSALGIIAEGIAISLYSEKLFELKAEALFLVQKYEDAIQLCENTLAFADKSFSSISLDNSNVNASSVKTNSMKPWRSHILAKCYFHLGRLEAALGILDKHEQGRSSEDSDPLAVTITELLKHKTAGNEAFRSGKHAEAVDNYTSAISCSIESRPFAAVCFCNRAAAYQVLGQIADAISDCSVAMALDENYVKALSRRANLYEKIRDYKQAASDLEKLVSFLTKRTPAKVKQSGSSNNKELDQAYQRLSSVEVHAKKEISLDLYLILGVKRADTASEIKKAYRKAALKHHPDKAGQLLVRSESSDDGRLWKDIAELVHKDSDRLFKIIGEAYAVLSDPEKREEYDLKEDLRSASRVSEMNRSASRRESEYHSYSYGYPFERSTDRRQWQGGYKSRSSYARW